MEFMSVNGTSGWYDNIIMVIVLLFLMPPIGILGVALTNKLSDTKKGLLTVLGVTNLTLAIAFLIGMDN